jgi:hypothetical protein
MRLGRIASTRLIHSGSAYSGPSTWFESARELCRNGIPVLRSGNSIEASVRYILAATQPRRNSARRF